MMPIVFSATTSSMPAIAASDFVSSSIAPRPQLACLPAPSLAIYLDLLCNELQAITAFLCAVGLRSGSECCSNARVGLDFVPQLMDFAPKPALRSVISGRTGTRVSLLSHSSLACWRFQSVANMHYNSPAWDGGPTFEGLGRFRRATPASPSAPVCSALGARQLAAAQKSDDRCGRYRLTSLESDLC